jgi:hypothetical protein
MNNFILKLQSLLPGNRKILIPLIPLVLFLLIFIFAASLAFITPPQEPQEEPEVPIPTPANETVSPTFLPTQSPQSEGVGEGEQPHGETILYENSPLLEKKESFPDLSKKYSLTSSTPDRPNVIITIGEEQNQVFQRSVIPQSDPPITIPEYLEFFGQPERTIKGSHFYGPDAQIYIYAQTRGFAYIANTQTNRILELHTFAPMSVEDYTKKYGEDIITPAP